MVAGLTAYADRHRACVVRLAAGFGLAVATQIPCISSASAQTPPGTKAAAPAQSSVRRSLSAKEVFETWKDSVFTVRTATAQGTGCITPLGIATCYHVVDGAQSVNLEQRGKGVADLQNLWAASKEADVAVLSAPTVTAKQIQFASGDGPAIGDPLYVIGSPLGLEQSLTEGLLSGRRTEGGLEYLQLSASVSPGSSGSPVFDKYGDVVGIVVSSLSQGQQLNFAISARAFMSRVSGVPLSEVFRPDRGLSMANPEVRKVATLASTSLGGMPEVGLVIDNLPPAVLACLSVADIEGWARAELARSAPSLKLALQDDRAKSLAALAPTDLAALLARVDNAVSSLHVGIGLGQSPAAHIGWYSAEAYVYRVGLLPVGLSVVRAWQTAYYGVFGDNVTITDQVRDLVTTLVRQFCDQWSRDNGSPSPDLSKAPSGR